MKHGELFCLSRFLSEYKIKEFYNKMSSNVSGKYNLEGSSHSFKNVENKLGF